MITALRSTWPSVLITLVFGLGGCTSDAPTSLDDEAFVRVVARGDLNTSLNGTAGFSFRSNQGRMFTMLGRDPVGASIFMWSSRTELPTGTYPIIPASQVDDRLGSFAATFSVANDDQYRAYVADSGVIQITTSTPDRIEGSFSYRGILFCIQNNRTPMSQQYSCQPRSVGDGAPRIEVAGTFVVPRDTATGTSL